MLLMLLLLYRQLNDELTAKTASLVQEADAVLVSVTDDVCSSYVIFS